MTPVRRGRNARVTAFFHRIGRHVAFVAAVIALASNGVWAEPIALRAGDGLTLELDSANGAGIELGIGDFHAPLSGTPLIRLEEVVERVDAANLLEDASPKAWAVSDACEEAEADGELGPWLRVAGPDAQRPKQTVAVGLSSTTPLVVSGCCQARVHGEAFGWWNRNLAINAAAEYVDGTKMPERSAWFGQYDHGPQFNKAFLCPDRPVRSVALELTVPGPACTAWYKDVALREGEYRIFAPNAPLERIDACALQTIRSERDGLQGSITFQPEAKSIEIRCSFENMRQDDRAVSAYVAIPFDALGGEWFDHARASRRIEAGRVYRDAVFYGAGRDGWNNRYPFACVTNVQGVGLALGVPMDEPRVFQTEYDAQRREFRVRFDFGLSPDAGRWANRGAFTAHLFRFDGRDGFRGAAAAYYALFEASFRKRVQREGLWLPFLQPTAIAGGWQDFHFQFLESTSAMGWAAREGMSSLHYVEPWIHHHEFPPHLRVDEVHGPVAPRASLEIARRMTDPALPLDMRRRYAAYPGSCIEDAWGEPQGYFFRHEDGGRNENMMIVNPNDCLPAPRGADYASGAWDKETIREDLAVERQWSIDAWTPVRTSAHPFDAIDPDQHAEGRQSLRLDPIESKSYFEQHLRGIGQAVFCREPMQGPFTLRYRVRGEHVPSTGTLFRWVVTCWRDDGSRDDRVTPLEGIDASWRECIMTIETKQPARAISVTLTSPVWDADSTVLWIDDVKLSQGDGANLLENGGFEKAELLPCHLDGVYLDTMECYEGNLNYRREHWSYTEEPLTFDCARRPAMHQVYSHVAFARHMAEWLRDQDRIVFGNCAPRTPFAAPYLDAMGTELNWKPGGVWTPWPDEEFNFARFMCRTKPFHILQYADLDVEEETRYIKRCLFYGVFPSNQAAPYGGWYWADPIAVARHRDVFKRYVPLIIEIARAGWEPVTLATCSDPDVWLERFGNEGATYLAVFNPTREARTVAVTLDPRYPLPDSPALESLASETHRVIEYDHAAGRFEIRLEPEDVGVIRIGGPRLAIEPRAKVE